MEMVQKLAVLENRNGAGQKYCNAIDEDTNDSDSWSNRMPGDGYEFSMQDNQKCVVSFTEHFQCYDGWDSHNYEVGTYNTLEDAVNHVWKLFTAEQEK